MPEGAELIDNPISVAPGFRLENVYVLPGVPKIMQAMLDGLLPRLRGGAPVLSRAITVLAPEGDVAAASSATFRPASRAGDRQLSVLASGGAGDDDRVPRHRSGADRRCGRGAAGACRQARRRHAREPDERLICLVAG